jgi:hypothetical protein
MNWTDASGQFKVQARLVGRTETHVKLKKKDDSVVEVPIKSLSTSLQAQITKVVKAEKDFVDASLVRVGDKIKINFLRTWYPATVTTLLPDGATVEYQFVGKTQVANYKHKDMRYPNGEGPWADWKDITGKHEVKARYLTHDETDVPQPTQAIHVFVSTGPGTQEREYQCASRHSEATMENGTDYDYPCPDSKPNCVCMTKSTYRR